MADDIDANPFFQALKTTFQQVYNDAAENQRTICVPHSRSFDPEIIDQWFIESHILTASPYFAGQYVTPNGKSCEMEDGESNLLVGEGYGEEGRIVKILSENVFYNREYKSYRVLITDSALEGPQNRVSQDDDAADYADVVPPSERTFRRLLQFLVSFAGIESALQRIDLSVRNFNRTYEIVEGWEQEVGLHCDEMCHRAKDLVFEVSSVNHYSSGCAAHMELIEEAVESYVMGGVHDKIFQEISQTHGAEDARLARSLVACTVSPEDIGVRGDLCNLSLAPAVQAIKGLVQGGVCTPREKLCTIQKTTTQLTQLAEAHLAAQGKTSSDHALTTDDLLPLLCMTLIKAAPPNLVTHSVYLSNFNASGTSTTELGFHLANFQAAIQFLRESPTIQASSEPQSEVPRGAGLGLGVEKDTFSTSWMLDEPATRSTSEQRLPKPMPQEVRRSPNQNRSVRPQLDQRGARCLGNNATTGLGDFLDSLIDEGSRSITSRQFYSQK